MDTEKKSGEQRTDQPKPDIGEIVGDLVVSGATILAHSAAEAVVKRVKKAARPRSGLQGTAQKGARIRFFA